METAMTIILAIIGSGVLNIIINRIFNIVDRKREDNSARNRSIRLLMKKNIKEYCLQYLDQGWIYYDELEDLIAMHSCYHNDLNGNGYLDVLMAQVKALEVRGIPKKEKS